MNSKQTNQIQPYYARPPSGRGSNFYEEFYGGLDWVSTLNFL